MESDEQGESGDYRVQEGTIFISGMGTDCNEQTVAEFFGGIGVIKTDKNTGKPKVWLYKDKATGENKGEATVTYDDPPTAESAIKWFNDKDFHGNQIKVELARVHTAPKPRSRESMDRNPSPPPAEVIEDDDEIEILTADLIEGTAFSKKWTLATLLKLGKEIEKENDAVEDQDAAEVKDHGIDIPEELEVELCRLWDMATNMQVCRYLEEYKAADICMDAIIKSNAPRIVEIAMGILGNMACYPPIALNFSENKPLRDLILTTLGSSDARTLIETTRLITTCLSISASQELWLSAIARGDEEVFDKLCFILKSSTNGDLLHATTNLVDTILDIDEEILNDWANTALIEAIVEANKQVKSERRETVGLLLHVLNIVSTVDSGVETLVESTQTILPLLVQYIGNVCEQEEILVSVRGQENNIASAVSVLDVLANTSPPNLDAILKHESKTLPRLLCILSAAKDTSPGPPKSETLPTGNNNEPKSAQNANNSSSTSSNVAGPSQSDKEGGEASHDASIVDVSQDSSITEVSQGTPGDGVKVPQNPAEDEDDSDIEEIECVAVVTKESNFLTDVLMEFFCNLLENHDAGTSELLSCLNSCNKEHVNELKNSLKDTNPDLLAILENKPSG